MELATIEEAKLNFRGGSQLPIQRISPSPCTLACPAGVNVKAYVSLMAEGRYAEALHVVREKCSLPGVCGRVCNHPCESVCRRSTVDGPVSIRALKRFLADLGEEFPAPPPLPSPYRPERIAVIGSGPSGLTCANDLARMGFRVTLLEAETELGGMLRYGIPDYRLPREILDREIEALLGASIEVKTGCTLGNDVGLDEILSSHAAVYLAVGAMKSRQLGLDGENEIQGVEDALRFLKRVNEGDRTPMGERVLVIGGGSSAIDAARTAIRLGAKSADIVYRRSKEEMPAAEEEIRAAEAEGVGFRFLSMPEELKVQHGRVVGLGCLEVRLGEPDASGRRRPIPVSGSGFTLRADTIVSSIGQEPYLPFLGEHYDKAVDRWGNLATDEKTGITKLAKVFAGGDVSTGPATVIEGIGAGHRAAAAIRRFVEAGPGALSRAKEKGRERWELGLADPPAEHHERLHAPERPLTDRDNFEEVEWALSEKEAREEASRCLRCGPCSECWHCVPTCSRRHVLVRSTVDIGSGEETLDLLLRTPREGTPAEARAEEAFGDFVATDPSGRELEPVPVSIALVKSQVRQELCRGCGRCVEVCAFHAPRLVMGPTGEPVSRIDATLCRGCGLCVSVCQTGAAEIEPFSKSWILGETDGRGLKKEREEGKPGRIVVITCQRRGGCITPGPNIQEKEVDVLRLSCVGQIEAGTILKLIYEGADRVIVAGCAKDRCRFESGAGIGHDQVELARTLLRLSGYDPERVQSDWSEDREGDPLPLEGLVTMGGGS